MITFFRFFFAILFVTTPPLAWATEQPSSVAVEAILFDEDPEGEYVRIRLSGRVEPVIFQLPGAKPRVVCDLPAVAYPSTMKKVHPVGGDLIERIRVGVHRQPEPKTRIVIDLARQDEYTVIHEYDAAGSSLDIRIAPKTTKMEPNLVPDDGSGPEEDFTVVDDDDTPSKPPESSKPPAAGGRADDQPVAEPSPEPEEPAASPTQQKEEPEEPAASPTQQKEEPEKEMLSQEQERILEFGIDGEEGDAAGEDDLPVLLDVSYESGSGDKEMVLFRLSGFYPPVVFSTEGDNLLVVCDFLDTLLAYGIDPVLQTEGKYIQKIRTEKKSDSDKVRVVLDLAKGYDYDVKQVFFKDDNLFVVVISSLGKKE